MNTRTFSLEDILTITTSRILTERGFNAVTELCNFMTGNSLMLHQLKRAIPICKESLIRQFPQFDTPEMNFEVGKLILMMESPEGKKNLKHLILGWLLPLHTKFGEYLSVAPLEEGEYIEMDPIEELEEMVGKEKVITVDLGNRTEKYFDAYDFPDFIF